MESSRKKILQVYRFHCVIFNLSENNKIENEHMTVFWSLMENLLHIVLQTIIL